MKQLSTLSILLGIVLLLSEPIPVFAADEVSSAGIPEKVAAHNDQGILLLDKDEYGAALLEFNRALAEDPRNVTVLINRGVAFAKRGQYGEAIENFYYALDFNKNNVIALKRLATAYLLTGNPEKAIDVYNRIASLSPSDFQVYAERGAAYLTLSRYDTAMLDFARTLYLNPRYYPAYIGRGILFKFAGKFEWAISDFDNALMSTSGDPYVYLSRSEAYAKKDDLKNALADLHKACTLGYSEVCEVIRQAKADIEGTEVSFSLQYARKTPDEELYSMARKKLGPFFNSKMSSGMNKYFINDLKPVR